MTLTFWILWIVLGSIATLLAFSQNEPPAMSAIMAVVYTMVIALPIAIIVAAAV